MPRVVIALILWMLGSPGSSSPLPFVDMDSEQTTFCADCMPSPYELRVELTWERDVDLDLHTLLPSGHHVYYGERNLPDDQIASPGWLDDDHQSGPYPSVGERLLVTADSVPGAPPPTQRRYCLAVGLYSDLTSGDTVDFSLFVEYRERQRFRCRGQVVADGTWNEPQRDDLEGLCAAGASGPSHRFSVPLLLHLPPRDATNSTFEGPASGTPLDCTEIL
ncbi:MAG: hypothetical protein MPN21_24255 [Thermoanaerobaculia bacterium]|nr:hypothetical protein [Thermoanaerobaculia bacterium]